MSALGKLVVSLSLEHAQFSKGLDKSSQEALRFAKTNQDSFDKFSNSATSAFKNVGASVLGAVAAFTSVTFVINQLTSAFKFADNQILDVAQANEVAVGSVLKLSQALMLTGGSATDSSKVFSALTKSIDAAAQGTELTQKRFASLGISLQDLRTLDSQTLFEKTLAGLRNIEDPIQRNASAMDLLGKAVKGVDIVGLADSYANNQGNFDKAEESFAAIGEAMDRLDAFTFKTSQTLAENFGPALLAIVKTVDDLVFGFDNLKKNISKATNANTKFKPAPRIGDAPVAGAFNLPPELMFDQEVREVIDKAAERSALERERLAKKARDEAMKWAEQERKDWLADQIYQYETKKKFSETERKEWLEEQIYQEKIKKEAEKDEYERKQKYVELLQKQANANFDEAQAKVKEIEQEAKRASDEINRSLTDALLRGFESGKSFARNFRDTLVNMFQTLILRPVIEMVLTRSGVTGLLGGIGSLFSGNALAGEGGGFGLADLKDIGSVLSKGFEGANIAFEQSIQQFGTFLTDFGSIGKSIGGAISQYSGFLSSAAPFLQAGLSLLSGDLKGAAFQGAGAAIGSIFGGPVGGAIGSFLGGALGGLFGSKKQPPRQAGKGSASFIDGVLTSGNSGITGRSTYNAGIAGGLEQATSAFAQSVGTLLKAFGKNGDVTAFAQYSGRAKSSAFFQIGSTVEGQQSFEVGKYKDAFSEANFNQFIERLLGVEIVKVIQKSSLADGVKKFFDGLTKKEDVLDAIQTLSTLNLALKDLPPIFNAVRNAIDTTAYDTSIAALKAQFQATQTFVDLFYSSSEKFDIFTNQLLTQFDALNQTIPTSRDQYRALVESINVVDDATRNQFNGLIALAPAMNQYFEYLEQQADGINQVNQALADALEKNLFSTYADYVTAQANASAGMTFTGSVGDLSVKRAQGDAELANAVKTLVAQQARTDQILQEIAASTRKTAEVQERWNGDGLPETRVM